MELSKKNSKNNKGGKKKAKVKVFSKKKKVDQPENVVIEQLKAKYDTIDTTKTAKFIDLPLSQKTIKGLKESKYFKLTDIQKASIPLALKGKDILGAAQTGSGKTLAFLVPILERLYCEQWTRMDGLGALVITPTRELAYQIFETLRKIGKYHDFSAGLVIGGKDLKFETKRMDQCNVVICTPGRLLQHMDENPLFDCVTMKILVLDEADRCLDMGFKDTMNAIIANLPPERQTLLFSATQTKSVHDLARLSLKDPSYVSVNEMRTPKELQQSYVVCELQDKLSILWSFVKNHLKHKTIIFFTTCKQVKYFYEMFCKLRPGLSLLPLYGTLHQLRRMKIYEEFCRKKHAVLFATDLAARGLDFPEVHWVVQADCPEDIETYIHRVGRTARYHKDGESLLMLMPSELKMLEHLEEKKIPIDKIDINPSKLQNPIRKVEAFLARDSALKDTAQRVISHYAKAIYFMKHKDIFNVQALDFESYSKSLGLSTAPRIRFLDRMNRRQQIQNANAKKKDENNDTVMEEERENKKTYFEESESEKEDSEKDDVSEDNAEIDEHQEEPSHTEPPEADEDSGISETHEEMTSSYLFKANDAKPEDLFKGTFHTSDSGDEDDLLPKKRRDHDVEMPAHVGSVDLALELVEKGAPISKAAVVKTMLHKKILANKKIVFDDEGNAVMPANQVQKTELAKEYEKQNDKVDRMIDIEKCKAILKEEDKVDVKMFREKVKCKHKEQKRKLKELKKGKEEEDEEGRDDEDEEQGPDLSWLPDPDQVYGEKDDSDGNSDDFGDQSQSRTFDDYHDADEEEESDMTAHKKKKDKKTKKRKIKDSEPAVKKKKKKQKIKEISNDLDVNETEELALMLLSGKK